MPQSFPIECWAAVLAAFDEIGSIKAVGSVSQVNKACYKVAVAEVLYRAGHAPQSCEVTLSNKLQFSTVQHLLDETCQRANSIQEIAATFGNNSHVASRQMLQLAQFCRTLSTLPAEFRPTKVKLVLNAWPTETFVELANELANLCHLVQDRKNKPHLHKLILEWNFAGALVGIAAQDAQRMFEGLIAKSAPSITIAGPKFLEQPYLFWTHALMNTSMLENLTIQMDLTKQQFQQWLPLINLQALKFLYLAGVMRLNMLNDLLQRHPKLVVLHFKDLKVIVEHHRVWAPWMNNLLAFGGTASTAAALLCQRNVPALQNLDISKCDSNVADLFVKSAALRKVSELGLKLPQTAETLTGLGRRFKTYSKTLRLGMVTKIYFRQYGSKTFDASIMVRTSTLIEIAHN